MGKKRIRVMVMGVGGVGVQLIQHIITCRSYHANHLGINISIVGLSDSHSLLLLPSSSLDHEFDDAFLTQLCHAKSNGSSLLAFATPFTKPGAMLDIQLPHNCYTPLGGGGHCEVFTSSEAQSQLFNLAASSLAKSTGLCFVDCSASSETTKLLIQVANLGCCIVMANKKPLTSSLDDYDKLLTYPRRIRYESTVGAGLPVIASLNRLLSSGDQVHCIVGSLSGTLGYVMSEVEVGKPFSQVVKSAKSLGYTEPDPRDDLGGMDVARKALIVARLLGQRIDLDSIKVESLYPEAMGPNKMTLEEFLENGLPLLDKEIQARFLNASSKGNVLRYVCVIDKNRCEVGIQELPKSSALGRLRGSDNVLEISSRCYNQQPLVIQGAGAGNDTTAAGVLADILDLQDLFR